MFQESLDSRGHAVPVIGSVCPEITPSRIFTLEHSLGYFLKSIQQSHPPEVLNTPVETAEQE
jgi:hypothetical protein